jgi:hypothetical protein
MSRLLAGRDNRWFRLEITMSTDLSSEVRRRRTFAIISHPHNSL